MRFRLEDVHTVAATALTDSPDDKKCDLVYVDEESGDIVVAQGYMSLDSTRPAAKSNKASDLNTAAAWLFGRDQADLPESLRPAAGEISAALQANTIRLVQFWFVHNLPESHNVRDELRTVESTVRNSIAGTFAGIDPPEISAIEVGRDPRPVVPVAPEPDPGERLVRGRRARRLSYRRAGLGGIRNHHPRPMAV